MQIEQAGSLKMQAPKMGINHGSLSWHANFCGGAAATSVFPDVVLLILNA